MGLPGDFRGFQVRGEPGEKRENKKGILHVVKDAFIAV